MVNKKYILSASCCSYLEKAGDERLQPHHEPWGVVFETHAVALRSKSSIDLKLLKFLFKKPLLLSSCY